MVKIRKKYGKINKKSLLNFSKLLLLIEYEIKCIKEYVAFLEQQIQRLQMLKSYHEKYQMAMRDEDKRLFAENIKNFLVLARLLKIIIIF